MGKGYVLDIKRSNANDYVLNLNNINKIKGLDLDINSSINKFKIALDINDFKEAKNVLEVLNRITEYGDSRVSDSNILFRAKKITFAYKKMNKESIINNMIILIEIRKFFSFLSTQTTFNSNDEKFKIIDEIHEIRDSICIERLVEQGIYKSNRISLDDLEKIVEFKNTFSDKELDFIDDVYIFFKNKINSEIKKLGNYRMIFKNRYKKDFYYSDEYKNLYIKDNIEKCDELVKIFDNCYLLYRFNHSSLIKEKETILMELLENNYINLSSLYREYIAYNISSREKKYTTLDKFISEANKVIESIRKQENVLNAIII